MLCTWKIEFKWSLNMWNNRKKRWNAKEKSSPCDLHWFGTVGRSSSSRSQFCDVVLHISVWVRAIVKGKRTIVIWNWKILIWMLQLIFALCLTFSFIFEHFEGNLCALCRMATSYVLVDVTEGTDGHGHENDIEIGSLVHPTTVSAVRVEVIESDQIRFEVLLPVCCNWK